MKEYGDKVQNLNKDLYLSTSKLSAYVGHLKDTFASSSSTLKQMKELCLSISSSYNKFNLKNEFGPALENEALYNSLGIAFGDWGEILGQYSVVVERDIFELTEYTILELEAHKEVGD